MGPSGPCGLRVLCFYSYSYAYVLRYGWTGQDGRRRTTTKRTRTCRDADDEISTTDDDEEKSQHPDPASLPCNLPCNHAYPTSLPYTSYRVIGIG